MSFVMLLGKWIAYLITDSTAIFSDAAESVIHIFAIGIASFSLWYSEQPEDEDHPYGHSKIVYFSAAGEGILIFLAAVSIIFVAIQALVTGSVPNDLDIGIIILAFLSLINLLLGTYLVWTGKKTNSLVLIANGKHILADMWTSLGVVIGVSVVYYTGFEWLDPVIAMMVGMNIIVTSAKLLKTSFSGLMDQVDPSSQQKIIGSLEESIQKGWIEGFHQLRHRYVNDRLWIEIHLTFPETMPILEVHEKTCKVEIAIEELFPKNQVWITTHMEPAGDQCCLHPDNHFEVRK